MFSPESRPCGRDRPPRIVRLCLGAALALCASAPLLHARASSQPRNLQDLRATPEWEQVSQVWHALLDYSDQRLCNLDRLRGMAKTVEAADPNLHTLADRRLMPQEVAQELAAVMQARYEYILSRYSTTATNVQLSAFDAAVATSQWIVEMQLSVLRPAQGGTEGDAQLAQAASSNLSFELTFLHHYRRFQSELDRRREQLAKQEKEGKTVDWRAFEVECEKRRSALLQAYQRKRLPGVRSVQAALPYLVALTQEVARTSSLPPPASRETRGI